MHVYRWDLDKTYLETDFHSIRGLLRSATEPAHRKRTIPGALPLMRALSQQEASRTSIISGSPTEMRGVLERKLTLDGITFSSLTLKDMRRSLKKGRFRAITGQFGYKLPCLLQDRVGLGGSVRETMFGDDAEIDAIVYSVYADAIAGRLSSTQLTQIMEAAGAYPDRVELAMEALGNVGEGEAVDQIFIRLERLVPIEKFKPLMPRVVPIYSWWQAALVLQHRGVLPPEATRLVLDESIESGETPFTLSNLYADLLRRGLVDREMPFAAPESIAAACAKVAVRHRAEPIPPLEAAPDYLRLLRQFG